ncbi:hypothetical protein ACWCPM_00760 [Streptomyces sp. NPDC002309]
MSNAKIAAALVGGYLMGRKKNLKGVLGLAMAVAVKRAKAGDLAEILAPVLGNLNRQARDELAGATKAAVGSVMNAQAGHLADALHQRTTGLQGHNGHRKAEGDEPEELREEHEEERERPRAKKTAHRPSSQPKAGSGASRGTSSRSGGSSRVRESDDD